ncbi:MAG: 3-methyl-2-oxobutanoate hydroxymethyltransferase [Gemmatimonas sp.]|nr:3-methyl-2-oxobutanoate hydroxymethyltransferase [Gemmatimonas sp.]
MTFSVPDLAKRKQQRQPIVMVTAYDYPSARFAEQAGVDVILVGDSAANVVLGLERTTSITMDTMVVLAAAARRGAPRALLAGDLPFMTYQASDADAVRNAGRFVAEAGCDAVKLEGGGAMVRRVKAIGGAGIAVIGHLGLLPQSAARFGGMRVQARTHERAIALLDDALALQDAGAVAIVLEAIPSEIAAAVTERLSVPTVGIGAGSGCDGQVLVFHDVLGLGAGAPPSFVRQYAALGEATRDALAHYAADVRERRFPAEQEGYRISADELAAFEQALAARDASTRAGAPAGRPA